MIICLNCKNMIKVWLWTEFDGMRNECRVLELKPIRPDVWFGLMVWTCTVEGCWRWKCQAGGLETDQRGDRIVEKEDMKGIGASENKKGKQKYCGLNYRSCPPRLNMKRLLSLEASSYHSLWSTCRHIACHEYLPMKIPLCFLGRISARAVIETVTL